MLSSIIDDANQSSMAALHLQNLALAAGRRAVMHIRRACAVVRHQQRTLSPRLLELQSHDFLAAHSWILHLSPEHLDAYLERTDGIDARNELFGELLLKSANLPSSSSIPVPQSTVTLRPARWTDSQSTAAPAHGSSSSSGSRERAPSHSSLRFSTTVSSVQADANGDFELLPPSLSRKEPAPTSTAGRAPVRIYTHRPSVVDDPQAPSSEQVVTPVKRASVTVIDLPLPQRRRFTHVEPAYQDGDVAMADLSADALAADSAPSDPAGDSGSSTVAVIVSAARLFDDEVPVVPSKDGTILDLTKEDTAPAVRKILNIDRRVYDLTNEAMILSPAPKFKEIDLDAHISSDEDADDIKKLLNDDDLSSACSS